MTYDENDDHNGPDSTRRGPFLFMAALVGVILIAGFGAAVSDAHAEGSDSLTPYTVTAEGVSLPDGMTFPDGGHVNWRTNQGSYGIHFESLNNQPSGAYIGQSFLPFHLNEGECIVWIQVSMFNEHYGEAGQPPICLGGTPSSSPSPTEPPASSEPPVTPIPTTTSGTDGSTSQIPSLTTEPSSSPNPSSLPSAAMVTTPDGATSRLADTGTTDKLGFTLLMGLVTFIGLGVLLISRRVS